MPKLEFSMDLPASTEKLIEVATQYENYGKFLEPQVKSVKIIEETENGIVTEEIFRFSSILNHEVTQKSLHKKSQQNKIETEVISGPFKGTTLEVSFDNANSMTHVSVFANVKIGIKYKVLSPLVKKYYRTVLMGLLYKMNNVALQLS
jgi:ribosome-associated toxin RatA of RatAB toxin-antitoxin module